MRLAVVGWANDSGVGRELVDSLRNLPVAAAFLFENPNKPTRRDLITVPHAISHGFEVQREMESFLDAHKPTSILTWEVPGSWVFPDLWTRKGIKCVHMAHWD